MTTTNIRTLREAGYLEVGQSSCTHQQVLDAAARMAMDSDDPPTTVENLYSLLWDECDMALAVSLNDMDLTEYIVKLYQQEEP